MRFVSDFEGLYPTVSRDSESNNEEDGKWAINESVTQRNVCLSCFVVLLPCFIVLLPCFIVFYKWNCYTTQRVSFWFYRVLPMILLNSGASHLHTCAWWRTHWDTWNLRHQYNQLSIYLSIDRSIYRSIYLYVCCAFRFRAPDRSGELDVPSLWQSSRRMHARPKDHALPRRHHDRHHSLRHVDHPMVRHRLDNQPLE